MPIPASTELTEFFRFHWFLHTMLSATELACMCVLVCIFRVAKNAAPIFVAPFCWHPGAYAPTCPSSTRRYCNQLTIWYSYIVMLCFTQYVLQVLQSMVWKTDQQLAQRHLLTVLLMIRLIHQQVIDGQAIMTLVSLIQLFLRLCFNPALSTSWLVLRRIISTDAAQLSTWNSTVSWHCISL